SSAKSRFSDGFNSLLASLLSMSIASRPVMIEHVKRVFSFMPFLVKHIAPRAGRMQVYFNPPCSDASSLDKVRVMRFFPR
ncbi:hypothetical protein, partial [Streptococcus pneumoniae]|uniref:hypothetical protein n=1 Tax=Streptococcus pneumoniae TaxID=1313 RepID=UPI001E482E35